MNDPEDNSADTINADAIVAALLRAMRAFVDTMPSCAWRRAIDNVLKMMETEVAEWHATPPTKERRKLMLEMVANLEAEVRGS
jgi:hypothetical protein